MRKVSDVAKIRALEDENRQLKCLVADQALHIDTLTIQSSSDGRAERERLEAFRDFQILDTEEKPLFDAFTHAAAELIGGSMSTISMIDEHHQWFKSHLGISDRATPRDMAFGTHVVASGLALVVADARLDERFKHNPLVTGPPHIRFYAGAPLTTPQGHTIGTLSVFNSNPLQITPAQSSALAALAAAVMATLESRRHFVSLFDSAHIDLFTIDIKTGTFLFASRGACDRLGYDLGELVGMPIFDVVPDLLDIGFKDAIQHMRAGQTITREADLCRRDGGSYPVQLRVNLTREQGEERVVAIAIDISEQKTAQREVDVLLRAINIAGDVILVYRAADDGELQLAYMNDAYTQRTGYTRDEAIGASLKLFRQDMPDDEGMRSVRNAIEAGKPIVAEIISFRKDGGTYWNQVALYPIRDEQSRITHWVSTERDITDEVNRTAALQEEHDRLLALARTARSLFTVLEAPKLIGSLRIFMNELVGVETTVLAVLDDGSQIEVTEIGRIENAPSASNPLVVDAVSGKTRMVSPKRDRAIAYVGRFGEAQYVLDLLQRNKQLRDVDLFVIDLLTEYFGVAVHNVMLYQTLDLRQSAVLELNQTKNDLIAMLAHDFRGPLTSIVGFADLLDELDDGNSEQKEFIETIKRSAMQLSELATNTLTLSRLERSEVTLALGEVRIDDLLRSIITQYANRREVQLSMNGDVHIVGDDERLCQVFSNLIDNAIKYSPDGSDPEVSVDGTGQSVVIRVTDRGIGIPPGEITSVFDRFSRASNARKLRISGTGFGLFLAKQIVALHGGTIALESHEGKGSTFTVTLPRRVSPTSAPRTIVVLDDERDRSLIGYSLREGGYRVVVVTTPEELFAMADVQSVNAIVVNVAEDVLSNERAMQLQTFGRERDVPIIAIADRATPLLGAAATLIRPALLLDVFAALERCFGKSINPE